MQITDLGLSVRATNCLRRAGITTVEELRQKRTWELQSIRSFGAKCMREVREALERLEAAKPQTNADRIRAMSDEELGMYLIQAHDCELYIPFCTSKPECGELLEKDELTKEHCLVCMMKWLQQPAAEG